MTRGDGRGAGGQRVKARRRGGSRVSAALVEHLPVGIFVFTIGSRSTRFRVADANRAAEELTGITRDELIDRDAATLLDVVDADENRDAVGDDRLERQLHEVAHERCYIANSLRSEVRVEGGWRLAAPR